MILTGKAKEDFEKWLDSDEDNLCGLDLFQLNETCINALIIDWFDSVGIYIDTGGIDYNGLDFYYNIQQKKYFKWY